jgi:hypothetical protein
MSLTALPKDLLHLLALHLAAPDIARLGRTCKSFARAFLSVEAEPLWHRVAQGEVGKYVEKRHGSWRETVAGLYAFWSFGNLPAHPLRDTTSFGAKLKSLLTRARPLVRVAVIGMRKSGKSTLICRLVPAEQPSIRCRALVSFKKVDFGLVEGDAATLRQREWDSLAAVILVVDCNDHASFPAAKR